MESKTVAIIGGGFAGAKLAERLEHLLPAEWQIELLIARQLHHVQPTVAGSRWRVALARTRHRAAASDHETQRASTWCRSRRSISPNARCTTSARVRGTSATTSWCSLAARSANLALVKGMARYALPLKTLGDAFVHAQSRDRASRAGGAAAGVGNAPLAHVVRRDRRGFQRRRGGRRARRLSYARRRSITGRSITSECTSCTAAIICCRSCRRRSADLPSARCARRASTCD